MSILYDRIAALCQGEGISGYRLCREIGIQPSILTDLKSGRKKGLSAETASKIAGYFGVSVGHLLGKDEAGDPAVPTKEAPSLTARDKRDIARDLERLMADLEGGDLMFDGDPMTDEAKASIRNAMQLGLEAAKLKNKTRFGGTP